MGVARYGWVWFGREWLTGLVRLGRYRFGSVRFGLVGLTGSARLAMVGNWRTGLAYI